MPTPRKALALHLLEGTMPKYPTGREPKPRPVAPKCPNWLAPLAKAEWRRSAPTLEKLGLLTELDSTGFAAYCQSYARWQGAERAFDAEPGDWHKGVAVRECLKLLNRLAASFGMDPASRSRINLPIDLDEDAIDDLLD